MSVACGSGMLRRVIAALGFTFLAACGGTTPGAADPAHPVAVAPAADDPSCPVAVPGTSVTAEDADKGAALVFITTGDVADVRRRAAELARMHNESHAKMGALPSGDETPGAAGHDHGAMAAESGHAGHDMTSPAGHDMGHAGHAGGMIAVHSRAVAEDLPTGARVVFVTAPADLGKMRDELARHVRHMVTGVCQMGR